MSTRIAYIPSAPRSISSDYSIISSFDALSLSSSTSAGPSRRASSSPRQLRPLSINRLNAQTPRVNGDHDDPLGSPSKAISPLSASESEQRASTGRSKAAARRERKRKLEAGERERRAAAEAAALLAEVETAIEGDTHLSLPTPPRSPVSREITPDQPPSPVLCAEIIQETQIIDLQPCSIEEEPLTEMGEEWEDDIPSIRIEIRPPSENIHESGTSVETETELEPEKPRRKTRRGGVKARRRAGRALADIPLDDEVTEEPSVFLEEHAEQHSNLSPTKATPRHRETTPVRIVVDPVPRRITYTRSANSDASWHSLEEADEVDDLSVLESEVGTPMSDRRLRECSVMTVEDATSSIDSFLSDPRNFMTIKANKLRLWQSLCIELGLVHMGAEEAEEPTIVASSPARPGSTPPAPELDSQPADRSHRHAHPVPQTLTQARKLLKDHAHVNLVDYLEARRLCPPAYVGAYQGLLYPSKSSMLKYTKKQGKFAAKGMVKVEWLEPLMKDWRVTKKAGQ